MDSYFEGPSKKARCLALFKEIQEYYKETNAESRLPTLTPGMLTKENKKSNKKSWPKLRAKAGEARALISFCRQAVHKYCLKDTEFESRAQTGSYKPGSLLCPFECFTVDSGQNADQSQEGSLFTSWPSQTVRARSGLGPSPKCMLFLECSRSPVPPSRTWSL